MIDRRTFLATSTMTVVAAALQDVALIGQGQLTTSFEELRQGGWHLQRAGRHNRVVGQWRRSTRHRQPECGGRSGLHRRTKATVFAGDRSADQHPSPR